MRNRLTRDFLLHKAPVPSLPGAARRTPTDPRPIVSPHNLSGPRERAAQALKTLLAALASSFALAVAPPVDIAAARAYAAHRPGTVAFAVRTETGFAGVGVDRVFPSASVLKAMLLVAKPRHARRPPFPAGDRALLAPMIRRSDNAAATTIFTRVGVSGLARLARVSGMHHFRAASPIWGNSRITARDQTRFFLHI